MSKKLKWDEIDYGKWSAASEIHSDGSSFTWGIFDHENELADGRYNVSGSSEELVVRCGPIPLFDTLKDAKKYCQKQEDRMNKDAEAEEAEEASKAPAAVQDKLRGGLSLRCDCCGAMHTVGALNKLEAHREFRMAGWDIETKKSLTLGDKDKRIIVTKAVCQECDIKILELNKLRKVAIADIEDAHKEALAAITNPKPEGSDDD